MPEVFDLKCGECGAIMALRESRYGPFYGCTRWPECNGTHGAHKADCSPLGTPADKATREARTKAHAIFDTLWKGPTPRMARSAAYEWLARKMMRGSVHIGAFTIEECQEAERIVVSQKLESLPDPGTSMLVVESGQHG